MAESERRLPIKIVLPRDDDLRPVPGGSVPRKVLDSVDRSVQDQLLEQVSAVRRHFSTVLAQDTRVPAGPDRFPGPEPARDYTVVGIIDSGTDPNNTLLQAWVVDRDEENVPRVDQDNNHGSFVAGLIINGRRLNHDDARFPLAQAKIVDVVGLPKPDTPVDEADLLRTIRRAVQKYRDVRVWNLSISRVDMVCRDDSFSDWVSNLT